MPEIDPNEIYLVNGEEVRGEDLLKGMMRQQDYTRKTQELAEQRRQIEALMQAAERYGMSPEELAHTAERAFGLIHSAEQAGVRFNPDGSVALPESTPAVSMPEPSSADPEPMRRAAQQLAEYFQAHNERLRVVEDALTALATTTLQEQIQEKYPDLPPEAVDKALALAQADPRHTPFEHAKWLSELRGQSTQTSPATLPGGGEGGTPASIEDKRVVFRPTQPGEVGMRDVIRKALEEE